MSDLEKASTLDAVGINQRVATGTDKEAEARPELVFEEQYGRASGEWLCTLRPGLVATAPRLAR